MRDLRQDIALTDPELARRTLESQAERFLPTVTGTPSTLYNVRHAIKRLLADWPKKSPRLISKIRKGDCEHWVASYGHLAPSTINTYISCATKFFKLAVTDGAIARSPMEGIKYHKRGRLTRLTPTAEQFEAIVEDLKTQSFNGHGSVETADYIALSGLPGLGQAELAGIQRKHIDLEAGTIKVFRRMTQQTFLIPIYTITETAKLLGIWSGIRSGRARVRAFRKMRRRRRLGHHTNCHGHRGPEAFPGVGTSDESHPVGRQDV